MSIDLDVLRKRIAVTSDVSGSGGGGSSKGAGAQKSDANNTLRSAARARLTELLGEGEIVGLVNGAKSIYFDGTPLQNADGSFNFTGVTWQQRTGLPDQEPLKGVTQTETPFQVGVEVKANQAPPVRTIADRNADAVRVVVQLPSLVTQDQKSGSLLATSVSYAIDVRSNNGTWTTVVQQDFVNQKTTSPYEKAHRVDLPIGGYPWDIHVRRLTPDSTSEYTQNATVWANYTVLVEGKFTHPNSALVAMEIDARNFGTSVPTRYYDVKGLIIQVPDNYDPETRTYSGMWLGSFKRAWSNNPAWVLYDLLTNNRYGLGEFVDASRIDKWGLYTIAQYCDQLVDDGYGGREPRFTFNSVINSREEAFKVLQTITTAFRGMAYWSLGQVFAVADMPADVEKVFSPANVVGGAFNYSGTAKKARHTVAMVSWNDPSDFYRNAVEVVQHDDALDRFGWRQTDVQAVGCTSRGQAYRYGKWILDTEHTSTETVEFECDIEVLAKEPIRPGHIIAIADPRKAQVRLGGRVETAAGKVVTLDFPFDPTAGEAYALSVTLPSGELFTSNIASFSANKRVVTLAGTPSEAVAPFASWVITGSDVAPRQYRVITVREEKRNTFKVTALFHDPLKFARVEEGIYLAPISYTRPKPNIKSPTNLRAVETLSRKDGGARSKILLSWTPADDFLSARYQLTLVGPDGNRDLGTTLATSIEIDDIRAGEYTFYVTAVGINGKLSLPASLTMTAKGWDGTATPTVSNLQVKGGGTAFSGKSASFTWTTVWPVGLTSYPVDFVVRIFDVDTNALVRTDIAKDASYTYAFDDNVNDALTSGLRGARRRFRLQVCVRDLLAREGAPSQIVALNPAPAIIAPVVDATSEALLIELPKVADPDFAGYLVWVSETAGINPVTAKSYEVQNGLFTFKGTPGKTYYVRAAAYDAFSKAPAGLNVSAEVSKTVTILLFDPNAPARPGVPTLVSTAEKGLDGTLTSTVKATWTAVTSSNLGYYEIAWQIANGDWETRKVDTNTATMRGFSPATLVNAKVRAFSEMNFPSDYGPIGSVTTAKSTVAPANPTNPNVSGKFQRVTITFTPPADKDLDYIEVWGFDGTSAATTPPNGSVLIGRVPYGQAAYWDDMPTAGQRTYWLRSRNTSDLVATSYLRAGTAQTAALDAQQLAAGIIDATKMAAGLEVPRVVSSLPTVKTGQFVTLQSDGKLYRWDAPQARYVSASLQISEITGLTADQIASVNAAVVAGRLTDSQIEGIAAGKVAGQLVNATLTAANITGQLQAAQVAALEASKITGRLTNSQLDDIQAAKIAGQLTNAQISDLAAAKLSGTIVANQIADAAITLAKFNADIRPMERLSALPTTGNVDGRLVYLTSDKKLYRFDASQGRFITGVSASDIAGTLAANQVSALEASKITGRLTNNQLDDIAAAKISGQLTDSQIAAINAAKVSGSLVNATLTAANISGRITSAQIEALDATKVSGRLTDDQLDGISAGKIAGQLVASQIAAAQIDASKLNASLKAIEIVSALPTTGNTDGRQVYLTSDKKLYRFDAGLGRFVSSVAAADVTGTLAASQIATIAAGQVTGQLSDSQIAAINAAKLTGTISVSVNIPAVTITGALTSSQIENLAATKIAGKLTDDQIESISAGKLSGQLLAAQIAAAQIDISKLASGLRVTEIVSALPTTGNVDGRQVYLTSDKKLYRYDASQGRFVSSVAASDITGALAASQITALEASKITGKLTDGQLEEIAASKVAGRLTDAQIEGIAGAKVTGAITQATLAAARLTGTISDTQIDTLSATKIAGKLKNDQLDDIQAAKIAGQLNDGQVAALSATKLLGQITAVQITDDAITAPKIRAGAITTTKIATNAVTANEILSGTITAVEIATGAITATKIFAGAVGADAIAANAVTATKISAGAVTAQSIAAGSILASKLAIASVNLLQNGDLSQGLQGVAGASESGSGLTSSSTTLLPTSGPDNLPAARYVGEGILAAGRSSYLTLQAVSPDGTSSRTRIGGNLWYEVSTYVNGTTGCRARIEAIWLDNTGASLGTLTGDWVSITGFSGGSLSNRPRAFAIGQAPFDATFLLFRVRYQNTAGDAQPSPDFRFSAAMIAPATAGQTEPSPFVSPGVTTIEGGTIRAASITAAAVAAGTITANEIKGGTITTTQIAAGAIEAGNIATGAITATKIEAGAVTATKIATGAVLADAIDADAVTAVKIRAGAIETAKLATGAVTTLKLDAGAVTADKIQTNAVTATKIDANAVTADKILAGSVETGKLAAGAVVADKIGANAVTATKIDANAVTADKILAGSVTTGKLDAGAVTADKIGANAVTATKINAGAVTAQSIAAGSILASKLAIATLNLCSVGDLSQGLNGVSANASGGSGLTGSSVSIAPGSGPDLPAVQYAGVGTILSGRQIAISAGSLSTTAGAAVTRIPATASQPYEASSYPFGAGGNWLARMEIVWENGSGDTVGTSSGDWVRPATSGAGTLDTRPRCWVLTNAPSGTTRCYIRVLFQAQADVVSPVVNASAFMLAPATAGQTEPSPFVSPGVSVIEGGRIVTNSVTATQIRAGTITANEIKGGTITANEIASGAVTTAKLDVGAVTANEIGANAVTATKILAGAVTTASMTAGSIDGDRLTANSVTVDQLAANSVTATQLAANAVTANAIEAGTITAAQIAGSTITADQLASNSVTATQLTANAVTADKILAGSVTTTKLDVGAVTADKIGANAVTATKISAGAVTAQSIAAGAITASRLLLTDTTNLLQNGDFAQGVDEDWHWGSGVVTLSNAASSDLPAGCPARQAARIVKATAAVNFTNGQSGTAAYGAPAQVGDPFRMEVWAYSGSAQTVTMSIVGRDPSNSGSLASVAVSLPAGTWTLLSANANCPRTGKATMRIEPANNTTLWLTNARFMRREAARLIVDGSIVGAQLVANTITAAQILGGTITATELGAGAVTADKIGANAVTADKILAGSVTTGKLDTGAVTADKIGANAVTATKILAGAVTTASMTAGTINGDRLFANSVTANQLAANSVSATNIIAGTITATELAAGAITAEKIATGAISARKLMLGAIQANMLPAGEFMEGLEGYTATGGSTTVGFSGGPTGLPFIRMSRGVTDNSVSMNVLGVDYIPCEPNQTYEVAMWIRGSATSSTSGLRYRFIWYDTNKSVIQSDDALSGSTFTTTGWRYYPTQLLAPGGTRYVRVQIYHHSDSNMLYFDVAACSLKKTTGATLIADDAITTGKIFANAITAEKLAINAVTADKILAGAITTTKIGALAVEAANLAAGAVVADKIGANAVTATKIDAGAVTTAKLDAFAVQAGNIAAGAVVADKIAANAVTATKIDALAVTTAKLAAGAVEADKIAANAVTATKIDAGAVTTAKLDALAVTAAKIAVGTITATQISGRTITANEIVAGTVTANEIAGNTITAAKIQAGAIGVDQLAAGAITTDKIGVGLGVGNLLSNADGAMGLLGWITDNGGTISGTSYTLTASNPSAGLTRMNMAATGGSAGAYTQLSYQRINPDGTFGRLPVTAGRRYEFSAYYSQGGGATGTIYVQFMDGSGAVLQTLASNTALSPAQKGGSAGTGVLSALRLGIVAVAPPNTQTVNLLMRMVYSSFPGNGWFVAPYFGVVHPSEAAVPPASFVFSPWQVQSQTVIDGGMLAANTVTAREIRAGTITTDLLQAGSINVDTIAAAGTISADKLSANVLTAANLVISGTTRLSSWATGTEINGGSIAANTIRAGSLQISDRSISISGLDFTYISATNRVNWAAGTIGYINNSDAVATAAIPAGGVTLTSATTYLYWTQGATSLSSTTSFATVIAAGNVHIATYSPATGLVVYRGSTMIDGSRIIAASITSDLIAAGAIQTGAMAAGSINGDRITAGTLAATKIVAGSITTTQLGANCVTADKIVGGTITATELASNAVTAIKIAADAVTADKLSVSSLSAVSANMGTVTAGQMRSSDGKFVIDLTNKRILISD